MVEAKNGTNIPMVDSEQGAVLLTHEVFQSIASHYDVSNNRISFGQHKRWKQQLVQQMLACPRTTSRLLDVCCGSGDIVAALASKTKWDGSFILTSQADGNSTMVPQSATEIREIYGLDFSANMLAQAAKKVGENTHVHLVKGDALDLPFASNYFDAVSISFGLRNTPNYQQVIGEMSRVCAPGGSVFCLDSSVPENSVFKAGFKIYFRGIMPFVGGGFKNHKEYAWLNASTETFLSKAELCSLFTSVGLKNAQAQSLTLGAAVLCSGQK
jgi:demethylmenaquinone methyltransferase/2-methoxy-6-polyprenyl-1,4-benzoquinol methylase